MIEAPIFAGDAITFTHQVINSDGNPTTDLAGSSIVFALSSQPCGEPIFVKTVGNGIEITDAATGKIEITLNPVDTENLLGQHYFEIEVTFSNGKNHTSGKDQVLIACTIIKPGTENILDIYSGGAADTDYTDLDIYSGGAAGTDYSGLDTYNFGDAA